MERGVTAAIAMVVAISIVSGGALIFLTNSSESDGRPIIYTSMNWQKEMVQEIVGDEYAVHSFVGAGKNPHTYEGTPMDAARVQNASAYFYIGSGMAWESRYVDAAADSGVSSYDCFHGADLEPYHGGCVHDHDHEEGEETVDLHIWTSPWNLTAIAGYVRDVMKTIDPDNATLFDEGYNNYVNGEGGTKALELLATEKLKTPAEGEELMLVVWHGSWGYLLRDCGIDQHSIEGMTDSTTGTVLGLEDLNHGEPFKIFVGTGAEKETASGAAPGCEMVLVNPLSENWLNALGDAIEKISEGLIEGEHS